MVLPCPERSRCKMACYRTGACHIYSIGYIDRVWIWFEGGEWYDACLATGWQGTAVSAGQAGCCGVP
jgi:hypothetical protein